jgi:CelD/BcsL family acetyltransferase involved in cellulose biosynthesis
MSQTAPDYHIEVSRSFDAVPREHWDAIHARCPDATVFQHYGWVKAWWQCSAPEAAELCIVTASQDGELRAIAPFYLQLPRGDSERSQLRFLGGHHNDYQGYLVEPGHTGVHGELHRFIRHRLPADEVLLTELRRESSLARWIAAGQGQRTVALDPTPCPMLRLDEAALDRYIDKRTLRRKRNRLRRLGRLAVEHISDMAAVSVALPALFEQHLRRWVGTPAPSLFRHARIREFYQRVIEELPDGVPVFSRVLLDDRVIACHLGFVSGDDLLWYKPAFDVEFAACSPGEILLTALIRHAQSCGLRALDFTRGDEAFKQRFSNRLNWNDSYVLYRSATRFAMRSAHRVMQRSYRKARILALRRTRPQRPSA